MYCELSLLVWPCVISLFNLAFGDVCLSSVLHSRCAHDYLENANKRQFDPVTAPDPQGIATEKEMLLEHISKTLRQPLHPLPNPLF